MSVFPKFTGEMYDGNAPCGKGHEVADGGVCDRWSTKYGGGETSNDKIICATFYISHKISIFICGDHLAILDIRYSGKWDFWEYTNDGKGKAVCSCEAYRHSLEPEKIEKILSKKIENCRFWDLVQARARELYEGSKQNENQT